MDTKFTVREELNNLINAIAEINNELKAMRDEIEKLKNDGTIVWPPSPSNSTSALAEKIKNELKAMHDEIETLQNEIYSKPPN